MKIINYLIAIIITLPLGSCSAMERNTLIDINFVNKTSNEVEIKIIYANGKEGNCPALVLPGKPCSLTNQNLSEIKEYKVSFRFMPTSDFGDSVLELFPQLRCYRSQTIDAAALGQRAAQEGCEGLQITLTSPTGTGPLTHRKYTVPPLKSFFSGFNYGTLIFGFGKPQIVTLFKNKKSEDKKPEITKLEDSLLEDPRCSILAESVYFINPKVDDEKVRQEILKALGFEPTSIVEPYTLFGLSQPPDPNSITLAAPSEQNQEVQRYLMSLKTAYDERMKKWASDPNRDNQKYQETGIEDFSTKVRHFFSINLHLLSTYLQLK